MEPRYAAVLCVLLHALMTLLQGCIIGVSCCFPVVRRAAAAASSKMEDPTSLLAAAVAAFLNIFLVTTESLRQV